MTHYKKVDYEPQNLNSIEDVLSLSAIKLYNKFALKQQAFIDGIRFFDDDVKLLIKAVKENNSMKKIDCIIYENSSKLDYSTPYCLKLFIDHSHYDNMTNKIKIINSEAIMLLSTAERSKWIERYVRFSQLKFRELLELYNQYELIESLRKGAKITNKIMFEKNSSIDKYAITLIVGPHKYNYYAATLLPPYNISEVMINLIYNHLTNDTLEW